MKYLQVGKDLVTALKEVIQAAATDLPSCLGCSFRLAKAHEKKSKSFAQAFLIVNYKMPVSLLESSSKLQDTKKET